MTFGTPHRLGLMWVAIATTCVTSSLFLTGLAPSPLARGTGAQVGHGRNRLASGFVAFAPVGIGLLLAVPLLTYLLPPKWAGDEVPRWARR